MGRLPDQYRNHRRTKRLRPVPGSVHRATVLQHGRTLDNQRHPSAGLSPRGPRQRSSHSDLRRRRAGHHHGPTDRPDRPQRPHIPDRCPAANPMPHHLSWGQRDHPIQRRPQILWQPHRRNPADPEHHKGQESGDDPSWLGDKQSLANRRLLIFTRTICGYRAQNKHWFLPGGPMSHRDTRRSRIDHGEFALGRAVVRLCCQSSAGGRGLSN
jgi:hypothetical protein